MSFPWLSGFSLIVRFGVSGKPGAVQMCVLIDGKRWGTRFANVDVDNSVNALAIKGFTIKSN